MILNIIILWILILILSGTIWCLYKWYKQEQQEQDERILVLEKRLEKYRKDRDDELVNIYDNISINNDDIKDLTNRIQKLERKKRSDKE